MSEDQVTHDRREVAAAQRQATKYVGKYLNKQAEYLAKYGGADLSKGLLENLLTPLSSKKRSTSKKADEVLSPAKKVGKSKAKDKPQGPAVKQKVIAKEPEVFACAGNVFTGEPCPDPANARKVRAPRTHHNDQYYDTCKKCKNSMRKKGGRERKEEEEE